MCMVERLINARYVASKVRNVESGNKMLAR